MKKIYFHVVFWNFLSARLFFLNPRSPGLFSGAHLGIYIWDSGDSKMHRFVLEAVAIFDNSAMQVFRGETINLVVLQSPYHTFEQYDDMSNYKELPVSGNISYIYNRESGFSYNKHKLIH